MKAVTADRIKKIVKHIEARWNASNAYKGADRELTGRWHRIFKSLGLSPTNKTWFTVPAVERHNLGQRFIKISAIAEAQGIRLPYIDCAYDLKKAAKG